MKKTMQIARQEFSTLFYSPIAWFLLIIFLVQCGLTFTDSVHDYLVKENMRKLFNLTPDPLTLTIMAKVFFKGIADKLYLYLPLLTMGLMSREYSSGTIKLLYSSPLRTDQIVIGKFLAMMVYNLLLIVILMLFVATGAYFIRFADMGMMLSGLFGIYLLLCAYSAIGLFMSCLTSYQVVAALSTLVVFAALQYLNNVWQGIDFVRDLTWLLSMASRTETLFYGMITSRDILYFLLVMALFLGFSYIRIQADRESRPATVRLLRSAGLVVFAVVIGYFTSRPALTKYWDVTAPKSNTLAPATQALLKSLGDDTLEVTAYVNLLDYNYIRCSPEARNYYLKIWEPYERVKPLQYHYEYYYDTAASSAWMMARSYKGKTLEEVAEDFAQVNNTSLDKFTKPEVARKVPGLRQEKGRLVMQLRYKGRTTFLRVFDDMQYWPNEEQVVAAIRRLMQPEAVPKVAFLQGGLERNPMIPGDRNLSMLAVARPVRLSLINNGFDADTLTEGQEIPQDLTALVIADPKTAFSPATQERLRRYVDAGGNLLVAGEPGKQDVLAPLLHPLGVQLREGVLVQQSRDDVPSLIKPILTPQAAEFSQSAAEVYLNQMPIYMAKSAALDYEKDGAFEVKPLMMTDNRSSWLKKGVLVDDSAAVVFDTSRGDEQDAFSPMLALRRKIGGKEQRIIIAGDADFMSNITLQARQQNFSFCHALFKWLSNGVLPVELSRIPRKDFTMDAKEKDLSKAKLLYCWVLPGMLLCSGAFFLIRRKRK